VYLHLYLADKAPSNSFTVVCYMVHDSFESWKWWAGGIFFAFFVACSARCALNTVSIEPE
jgi:hypothetical protein